MTPTGERRWERDRVLVARCLDGDAAAWEILIRRYRRLIFSIPVSMRLDGDRAEEVFQETCVRLYENLDKLQKIEGLASWLGTTARREALRVLRHAARWTELDEESALAEAAADDPDLHARLERVEAEHALELALAELDRGCAELLEALYREDPRPSYRELSRRLGRPVGSLGPTAARCLNKLRKLYRKAGGRLPWDAEDP